MADDQPFRDWYLKYQRLCMPPGAATAAYRWAIDLDVRSVLGSIQAPTLVIARSGAQHHRPTFSRYLADHIAGATFVELPGADTHPFQAGDFDLVLDHVEEFLTGAKPAPPVDRVLGTILFTDIVDSTKTAATMGDAAWVALRREHDDLVRGVLYQFRGREMKHTGDGFMALFDGPARAVTAADRIRLGTKPLGLEVRQGLHTGEVELVSDDIGGMAVHLANRIMSEAAPGTILASSTVKDLVLGSRIEFLDIGRHELKGVPESWLLFQVMSVP
jgi:class 3 adenylate cyclase